MAKFPSQRKMVYELSTISETTRLHEGYLNLPKDLSILNRRGYASTTRKGVPLVYKAKLDFYLTDDLGTGATTAYGADMMASLQLRGCQNNWVMRNAAVKWHAAREQYFRKAGVKKADRGAYSHEIRYNFDQESQTWLTPIDADGAAFTGGTWDVTEIVTEDDQTFELGLVNTAYNEDVQAALAYQQIGYSYLASRRNLREDTNDEAEDIGLNSILGDMLSPSNIEVGTIDNVRGNAEDEQDNVPYEHFSPGDVNHDITESVELGRAVLGYGITYGSCIVEIPFGLGAFTAQIHDAAGTNNDPDPNGLVCVEVLDIFEMQG